jgi:hypothetical protein
VAKILLINPNKWGRGITHIWIASHSSILKKSNHEVELFDCTFYADWTDNEIGYSTETEMFQKSNYNNYIRYIYYTVQNKLQLSFYESF